MGFSYLKQRILTNMCKRSFYHFTTSGSPNTTAKYVALKTGSFFFFERLKRK